MIRDLYVRIRRLWMMELLCDSKVDECLFVLLYKRVLSVGVGYWINENSIKWSDCSVM